MSHARHHLCQQNVTYHAMAPPHTEPRHATHHYTHHHEAKYRVPSDPYYNQQPSIQQQQYYHPMPAHPSYKARSSAKHVRSRHKRIKKSKEKPLLNQSCSLPEDDEVLRASVFLLEHEPQIGDGYSSDNALFYGKISVSKANTSEKTKYLKKLGKEVLTNNPKFCNINSKDQLAMNSSQLRQPKQEHHTLYNALTKRLNGEIHSEESDSSDNKEARAERDRRTVIRTRQKMRRRETDDPSFLFFKYGSVGAVLCNLSASTLGCSVLCIPYVFSLCGCLYGCIIILITVLLQLISMRLLLQCQQCTGVSSIQMLTILYLKNKCGVLFINSIIFGYCFTQCIAILIALADLIQPIFRDYVSTHSFLSNRSFLLMIVTLFILLPLSFHDKPSHLRSYHSSAPKKPALQNMNRCRDSLYNLCMIYFLGAITVAAMVRFYDMEMSLDSMHIHMGIYMDPSASVASTFYSLSLGFPIVLYCLTTHTELFKVDQKLSTRHKHKLHHIAHGALIQHTIYILVLATCGYVYFCENPAVETNVILNLKDKSSHLYISIAMAVIGIAMFLFYPTVLQPSTHSISVLLFANQPTNITQHILLTFFIDVFALLMALWIKDLAVLFAWSGAIFATILSLILPGLLFWNIIVCPSKTFVYAKRETANVNTQSNLNSIIATATPPLMNYARTVSDEPSLLSASQVSHPTIQVYTAMDGTLPNIMTPDALNRTIADSYSRLYGITKTSAAKATNDDGDEKYDYNRQSFDSMSDGLSHSESTSDIHGIRMDFNSDYVSLSSHTKRRRHYLESNIDEIVVDNYSGAAAGERAPIVITHSLKEASRSIQEKIEIQLKEEKIQRIIALDKVNQSWTFWFDRVGAVALIISGVILFVVGNVCNVLHIVDVRGN